DGETLMERLMAHQTKPIHSLHEACAHVSPALDAVFARMVAKTPGERYQNMSEVIADLQRCMGGESSAPSLVSSPGDDSRLSEFLCGMEPSRSPAREINVAPKTLVASPAEE